MLTSKDIKLLIDTFKTREEADTDLRRFNNEITEEIRQLRLDMLEKFDAVFKEVKDMRQEQDMHVQKHRDINEELDKLEASVSAT